MSSSVSWLNLNMILMRTPKLRELAWNDPDVARPVRMDELQRMHARAPKLERCGPLLIELRQFFDGTLILEDAWRTLVPAAKKDVHISMGHLWWKCSCILVFGEVACHYRVIQLNFLRLLASDVRPWIRNLTFEPLCICHDIAPLVSRTYSATEEGLDDMILQMRNKSLFLETVQALHDLVDFKVVERVNIGMVELVIPGVDREVLARHIEQAEKPWWVHTGLKAFLAKLESEFGLHHTFVTKFDERLRISYPGIAFHSLPTPAPAE